MLGDEGGGVTACSGVVRLGLEGPWEEVLEAFRMWEGKGHMHSSVHSV